MIKDVTKPRAQNKPSPPTSDIEVGGEAKEAESKTSNIEAEESKFVSGTGFTAEIKPLKRKDQPKIDRELWRELQFRDLDYFSSAAGNAVTRIKRGETEQVKPPVKHPPAVIYSAEELIFGKDNSEKLSPIQKRWKENIVTSRSLREPTEETIQSKNPLGMSRYLFVNAIRASKAGMLYYIVPLIINAVFLFMNIKKYAFMENLAVALATLAALKLITWAIKNKERGAAFQTGVCVAAVAAYFGGLYALKTLFPAFWAKIYLGFTVKLCFIAFCLLHFVTFYSFFALSYAQDIARAEDNKCVVECKAGDPGCGKTSQAAQEVFVIASMKWRELQMDFWSWHSRESEILKRNDKNELLAYHEIKTSYNYYIMRTCIPCLWSNIALWDDKGRCSSKVTLNHIRGIERLPLYSVVLFDEIGAVLKCEISNSKKEYYDVSDMFRLGRHFLKWTVICCEQDYNNIYIDCRRVMGTNTIISYQEWVCKPVIALGIYNFLKLCISDTLDRKVGKKPALAKFMTKFKKFVYSVGFRRQVYRHARNTETGNAKKEVRAKEEKLSGARVRYIPSKVIVNYDDRAYRTEYASYFDKEINGELHIAANVDLWYARLFVGETELLKEKRTATDGEIRKVA